MVIFTKSLSFARGKWSSFCPKFRMDVRIFQLEVFTGSWKSRDGAERLLEFLTQPHLRTLEVEGDGKTCRGTNRQAVICVLVTGFSCLFLFLFSRQTKGTFPG
jgi:hypothetical protein